TVSKFDASKISVAMTKAFLAVEGHGAAASRRVHEIVEQLTAEVVGALSRRMSEGRTFHIEDVQDQVELALMRSEHHKVARAYVSARLLLDKLRTEVLSFVLGAPTSASQADMTVRYGEYFPAYIKTGIKAELLDPDLARFDLKKLAAALKPERDLAFQFLGLQ